MSYIPKLNPTVGKGLPGFPERTGGDYAVGDIQYTEDDLDYKWLPADGAIVLQETYEKLFAKVGLQNPEGELGPKLDDPVSVPSWHGPEIDITEDGEFIASSNSVTPYLTVYRNVNNVLTKLANPATLPTSASYGIAWSPLGAYLAVGHNTSPFISVYKRSGSSLTKIADPSVLPTAQVSDCEWSPDGIYLATIHGAAPILTVYKKAGDTLTKLTNPAALPNGNLSLAWSADGVYLTVGTQVAPYIFTYKRTGDTFVLTTAPVSDPGTWVYSCAWSEDSVYLALGLQGVPYVSLYKRSGDVLTKLTITTGATRAGKGMSWAGNRLAVATDAGLNIYQRSGDTLSLSLPDLKQPVSVQTRDTSFSTDGKYLATMIETTPYIHVNYVPKYYDVDTEFQLPYVEATVTPRIKVL